MKNFTIGHDIIQKDDPNYCSIMDELRLKLRDDYAMILPENLIPPMYRIFFRSFAIMTKYHASKQNHKTGFSFKDARGQFLLGTILTYNPPEDDSEDGGSWNLSMTFYPEDMEGIDLSLDTFSDNFMSIVQAEMFSEAHAHCDSNADMICIISEFISAIKNFLDVNSNEKDPDVTLTMEGVFKASVGIEAGTKVYSIVPGATIKQIIKNDDATEKNEKAA